MTESDRQLQEMANRVAKQVESEKAKAKPADKKDAITPDFAAGMITRKMLLSFVAPSAREPS